MMITDERVQERVQIPLATENLTKERISYLERLVRQARTAANPTSTVLFRRRDGGQLRHPQLHGTVYFGFSGDVHAAPDLRRLETFLKLSFQELRDAARIGSPTKKKRRVRVKAQTILKSTAAPAATVQPSAPGPVPPSSVASGTQEPGTEEARIRSQSIA